MILPPRPQNHRPLNQSRRTLDLPGTVDPPPPRNRPELDRFAVPPWNPRSSRTRSRTPYANHGARVIDEAVDQLDLALLFASYLGVGSKAHRPDLMLKIALYEIQTGHHSPDQSAKDRAIVAAFSGWDWGSHPRAAAGMPSATGSDHCWRPFIVRSWKGPWRRA